MPTSAVLDKLTSPQTLTTASRALETVWAAWSLQRKPRNSASVLRRALVSAGVGQAATLAAISGGRALAAQHPLVDPVDGFRGPVGDVPVKVSPQWEGGPVVTEADGALVMLVGPEYEHLDRAEQEKQYHATLHGWFPPSTALALGVGGALSRAALHRVVVGTRGQVSKRRTTALAAAMTAADLALQAAARRVTTRRRQARLAAARAATPPD